MSQSDRWIYGFKRTGQRALTESELALLRRLARTYGVFRYIRGLLAVLCFLVAMSGIMLAAGGGAWGWIVLILGTIAFAWALAWANSAEGFSLLCQRASRVGTVDQYTRIGAPDAVRAAYACCDPDDASSPGPNTFWRTEEKFEELLVKEVGHPPAMIETPVGDDVLITIDGVILLRTIQVPSVSMSGPSVPQA